MRLSLRGRSGWMLGATALLLCAFASGVALEPPPASAQEGAAETEDARIAALQRAMEDAFLALASDQSAHRDGILAKRAGSAPWAPLLDAVVAAARADAAAPADGLLGDLRRAATDAKEGPLVSADTLVVLGRETVRRARSDAQPAGVALFLAVARDVLGAERTADAWDTWFTDAPTVAAWRAAHGQASGTEDGDGGGNGDGDGGQDPRGDGADDGDGPPDDDPPPAEVVDTPLVHFDRVRIEVGPWEGWIAELGDKAGKRHKVTVKQIWVEVHEVTCAQYLRFLSAQKPRERADLLPVGWTLDDDGVAAHPPGHGDLPVTGVTYDQARLYAQHLDRRLPTEEEWERIATGGDPERTYPWGTGAGLRTWRHGDARGGPQPVTVEDDDVSPEGVRGLAGNVAELTATLADRKSLGTRAPPDDARVVIRGGSFRSRASECSTRFRWTLEAGAAEAHVGFRCVMDEAAHRRRHGR